MEKVCCSDFITSDKPLTISRAVCLLSSFPKAESWVYKEEYDAILNYSIQYYYSIIINKNAPNENSNLTLPMVALPTELRCDNRFKLSNENNESIIKNNEHINRDKESIFNLDSGETIKIYSDYPLIKRCFIDYGSKLITFVNNFDDSNFIFDLKPIQNFYKPNIHQKVNQFPYEGGFIRKVNIIYKQFITIY